MVMPRTFWKNILRLIRTTKSRFFSLTAIVAIGVAFFVGVYSSSSIMSASVDAYDDAYGLKDIQIYSNYGFSEEDIEAVRSLPEIREAEGTKFADVIASAGTDTYVTRVHAWNPDDSINQFCLVEGRLPQNSSEALAERGTAISEVFPIGSEVHFSRPDDDLDTYLNVDSVTVVGLIDTPLYLNFSKENSTLSNQSIRTYLYVPEEAFSLEYDVEINALTEQGESLSSFSDAYREYSEEVKEEVESLAQSRQDDLYLSLKDEALEAYHDGLREYRDAEETFRNEIADAENTLRSSEQEIADGRAELEDGIAELQDSEAELIREEAENRKTLEDAIASIEAAQPQLESGISQLSDLKETRAELAKQREALLSSRSGLLDLEMILQLMPADAVFSSLMEQYGMDAETAAGLAAADPDWETKTAGELLAVTQESLAALDSGLSGLDTGLQQIDGALAEMMDEEQKQQADSLQADVRQTSESADLLSAELRKMRPVLQNMPDGRDDDLLVQVLSEYRQITGLIDSYPEETPLEYGTLGEFFSAADADLEKRIAALMAEGTDLSEVMELQTLKVMLQYAAGALPEAYRDVPAAYFRFLLEEMEDLRDTLEMDEDSVTFGAYRTAVMAYAEETEKALADAQNACRTAEQEASSLYQAAADAQLQKLNAQKAALADGLEQAQNGLKTLEETVASARQKISDGWAEIEENQRKLDDAAQAVADGWAELETERQNGQAELDDALAELADAKAQIDDMEDAEWTVLNREQHYASASFDATIDQMAAIGRIFPAFFLMVAVLVCLTTMARTVDEQRTEIGILRALGYSQMQCAGKYLIYAGIATLIGEAAGAVVGLLTFPAIIYNTWKMMYILPDMVMVVDWKLLVLTDAAFLAVMLLTTWLTCKADMREVPAQLLRPKSPRLGRNMLIEKITPLWRRISFTDKVTIRNIVRDRRRFVMTVIGVAGCTALLVTGFGIRDSISGMVDLQYGEIMQYDGFASIDNTLSEQQAEELVDDIRSRKDVDAAQMIWGYTSEAYDEKDTAISMTVQIFTDDSQISFAYQLRTRKEHEAVELTDDGVIISEKLSELLGISAGDTMRMEDEDGRIVEVRVDAVTEMYIDHYCFMSSAYYESVCGEKPLNRTVLIRGSEDDLSSLQASLVGNDAVTGITFFDASLSSFETMVSSLDLIVWTIIISSMALAFVVLGNLINVNISERQREIATLKVLGFHHGEVQSYIYKENNVLTFCGALAGIPLGIWLHRTIMLMVEMDYVMFGRNVSLISMAAAVVLTIVFGIMVNLFMRRRLRAIEMVESLKSVE